MMNDFYLNGHERLKLEQLLAHAQDSRTVLRAYALLWLDDGEPISEVAARLSVSRQSVYNWRSRWSETSQDKADLISRLSDAPRSGRPVTATDKKVAELIDSVIESDPRELQYRSTVWTAPLLAQYLSDFHQIEVSDESIRRVIKRLRFRWKRPRHSLALRSRTWRQAKGG